MKVMISVSFIVLLHFRLTVRRTGQETEKWAQPAADIASAITSAGGKPISLHHFPHIGIPLVRRGQGEALFLQPFLKVQIVHLVIEADLPAVTILLETGTACQHGTDGTP